MDLQFANCKSIEFLSIGEFLLNLHIYFDYGTLVRLHTATRIWK